MAKTCKRHSPKQEQPRKQLKELLLIRFRDAQVGQRGNQFAEGCHVVHPIDGGARGLCHRAKGAAQR